MYKLILPIVPLLMNSICARFPEMSCLLASILQDNAPGKRESPRKAFSFLWCSMYVVAIGGVCKNMPK